MPKFYTQDGQFWLDEQPLLIQAGELHYFRIPPDQWRHRLGLLQAAGFNTLATYIPWLWHQPEIGAFELAPSDLDGHSHPMRDLAGFLDMATEMGFLIIARPGPYIMAETINEGIPPWVFNTYPQAAFISQDGQTQNIASYMHPDFLACVRSWYRDVFKVLTPRQVTRGGNIIMVQLDNEMGMIPWVRNIIDTNPDTLAHFATYLEKNQPGHLSAGRENALRDSLTNPHDPVDALILENYRRFYRTYLREYTTFLLKEARACGLEVPPVVNIHGFGNGGKTFPIGLSQLAEVIAIDGMISATDVYPMFIGEGNFQQLLLVNEMTRTLQNPQQALFSIEFQAGGNLDFSGAQSSFYDLHTRLCISGGMRAINHYLFFDGENHPVLSPTKRHDWGHPVRKDGSTRSHYPRYGQLSKVLAAYGTDLVTALPETVTTIGFLLDHYMTEINHAQTHEQTNIITHQRDVINFDFLARGLAITHRPFNALELSRTRLDARQTPLCWAMMERQCDAATQQMLANYLHSGGRLVLVGRMCQEDFAHQPCNILSDAIGITTMSGGQPFSGELIHIFETNDIPASFVEGYQGEFDEVFAWRENGEACGIVKTIGKGQLLLLGATLAANTLADLDVFEHIARKMECLPLFELSSWADVRLSRGPGGAFLYINNYQEEPIQTSVAYAGQPLFAGQALRIPARRGLILPLDWRPDPRVMIHYCTAEVQQITEDADGLSIHASQPDFSAELTLNGLNCPGAQLLTETDHWRRVLVHATAGVIRLSRSIP